VLRRPVEFTQYLSLAYTDRLAELGIAPSVGSRGDSYDNALAEAVNAAYKTELINRGKPWRCIDDVELSTAEWVAWYNQERLHEALGYLTPAEYEAALTGASHPASQPTPALATVRRDRPADDALGACVGDERGVAEPLPGAHEGDVGHP